MSRALSPAMQALVAADSATFIYLLELTAQAATLRYTDYDQPITWNAQTFTPRSFTFGGAEHSTSLDTITADMGIDNVDLAVSGLVANQDVDGLGVRLWLASPAALAGADPLPLISGRLKLEEITQEEGRFSVIASTNAARDEVRPRWTFNEHCQWVFANADTCGASAGQLTGQSLGGVTVGGGGLLVLAGSVANPRTEATAPGDPGSFWADGFVTFTSGPANGQSARIKRSDPTTPPGLGSLYLDTPLGVNPVAGNLYTIRRGCNRTAPVCEFRFANLDFFGGFLNVPGRVGKGGL